MRDKEDTIYQHQYVNTTTIAHDTNTKQNIACLPGIKILHMNVRSLAKNYDELLVFLTGIDTDNIDLIILTEAFINDTTLAYDIPNFKNERVSGKLTRNEGVVIYFKSYLKVKTIDVDLQECTPLMLKIMCADRKINLTVLGIYQTPSILDPTRFIKTLEDTLRKSKVDIIAGDINIDIAKTKDPKSNEYLNSLYSMGYISCINTYTRITPLSKTCIDHIFAHQNLYDLEMKGIVIETSITDHFAQIVNIPCLPYLSYESACVE